MEIPGVRIACTGRVFDLPNDTNMAAPAYAPLGNLVTLNSQVNQTPGSDACWADIINALWGQHFTSANIQARRPRFACFFNYYAQQGHLALEDSGREILCRSHKEIIAIAQQAIAGKTRAEIWQDLETKLPNIRPANARTLIDNSIDLAGRLLLMIQVGDPLHFNLSRCDEVLWETGTIKEFLDETFKPQHTLAMDKTRLDILFNAQNLDRIAGLEIE